MKKLKLLGSILTKNQQKTIYGGYGKTIFCKKADVNIPACEIAVDTCPASNTWGTKCKEDATCKDYTNSASCG